MHVSFRSNGVLILSRKVTQKSKQVIWSLTYCSRLLSWSEVDVDTLYSILFWSLVLSSKSFRSLSSRQRSIIMPYPEHNLLGSERRMQQRSRMRTRDGAVLILTLHNWSFIWMWQNLIQMIEVSKIRCPFSIKLWAGKRRMAWNTAGPTTQFSKRILKPSIL